MVPSKSTAEGSYLHFRESFFSMPKGSFQSFQRVVLRYIVVIGNPTGLMLRTCRVEGFRPKSRGFRPNTGLVAGFLGWIWGLDGLDQDLTSDSSCLLLYSRLNLLGLSKMIWLATSPSGWQFQLLHLRGSEWTMFSNRSEPARAYPEKMGGTCFQDCSE